MSLFLQNAGALKVSTELMALINAIHFAHFLLHSISAGQAELEGNTNSKMMSQERQQETMRD